VVQLKSMKALITIALHFIISCQLVQRDLSVELGDHWHRTREAAKNMLEAVSDKYSIIWAVLRHSDMCDLNPES